jgi:hypothetical protein
MPRRKPAARPDEKAGGSADRRLSADDLDELLTQAKVPKGERAACIRHIDELFDWYRGRLVGNEQTEARRAESMRQVAEAARELYRTLASLPPALRLAAEPDYQAFAARIKATQVAAAVAAAVVHAAPRDPTADEVASRLPPVVKLLGRKRSPLDLLVELYHWSREGFEDADLNGARDMPLPLEHILAAYIETTEKRRLEFEAQVSRKWSKRRKTHTRNELARNLKAIIMGCSPALAEDQRGAEKWVALVLNAARILYPERESNLKAFNGMFTDQPVKELI